MISYYGIGRGLLFGFAILICSTAAGAPNHSIRVTTAQTKSSKLQLDPCHLPNVQEELKCGKFEVFEDRVGKTGRKIALNVVVMLALTDKPAPDPVFFLAGGPG